jgi:hypothetical protein
MAKPILPPVVPPAIEPGVSIIQPLIDELKRNNQPVRLEPLPAAPPQPAESDQDAGSGYNPDHTYPQT